MHTLCQRVLLFSALASVGVLQSHARWTPLSTTTNTLSRRSTTSEVVHDKFFVPAVAAMGALLLFALLCWFMIARGSPESRGDQPRGVTWAGPAQGAEAPVSYGYPPSPSSPNDPQNLHSLGRRRSSNLQRKPPPSSASPTNGQPLAPGMGQPFGAEHPPYPPQQVRMSVTPSNPRPTSNGPWAPHDPRLSVLSSGQSSTQVGSDGEPPKTKPYSAVGGYGFSTQGQSQPVPRAEFGAQDGAERSHPSTFGSNYNPYDGIDPTYHGGNGAQQGAPPMYHDPNSAGARYYDANKRAS